MIEIRKNSVNKDFYMIELSSSPKSTITFMVSKDDIIQLRNQLNEIEKLEV